MTGSRAWGGSLEAGALVEVADLEDLARVGHCWALGELRVGDVLATLRHSGDWFYDFLLLRPAGIAADGSVLAVADPREVGAYEFKRRLGAAGAERLCTLRAGGPASFERALLPAAFVAQAEAVQLRLDAGPARRASRRAGI